MTAKYDPEFMTAAFLMESPWDRACGVEPEKEIEQVIEHLDADVAWYKLKKDLPATEDHTLSNHKEFLVDKPETLQESYTTREQWDDAAHWDYQMHPMFAWHKAKRPPKRMTVTIEDCIVGYDAKMGWTGEDGQVIMMDDPTLRSTDIKDYGALKKNKHEV